LDTSDYEFKHVMMTFSTLKINTAEFSRTDFFTSKFSVVYHRVPKRLLDLVIALFSLFLLSPVFLILAIAVRFTSKGPVIYKQIRVGRHGKPFVMYKFRSMIENAEMKGPALSSYGDVRITSLGRFIRKTKLDEIPQFFNVLIGDMSMVGHRPERQFYINKIVAKDSHYLQLLKNKPGITSLGQVHYGYAENVDEMLERLKIDLLYLNKCSFLEDIKILTSTTLLVLHIVRFNQKKL